MHYRASSRGGRYGSCPQVGRVNVRTDIQKLPAETMFGPPNAYHTVTPKPSRRCMAVASSSRPKSLWSPNSAETTEIHATLQRDFGDNIREFESSRPSQAVGLHAPAHAGPFLWAPLRGFSFGRLSWRPHLSAAVVGPGIGQSEPPWLTAR
jgi:hypothetical protein